MSKEIRTRKIYYVSYFEDFEAEGFIDPANGEVLGAWHCNDGVWRPEYFNGFLEALGVEVVKCPDELYDEYSQKICEWCGG